jgi:hypothetical protein
MKQSELLGMINKLDYIISDISKDGYCYESAKIVIDAIKTRLEIMKCLDAIERNTPLINPKLKWDYMSEKDQ